MGFIQGTPIFTNSGWKNIEEISGQDKVLVRNFIGDAEFIQPFALKKKKYEGEIVKIGARNWSFSVTPDHRVVYDRDRGAQGKHYESVLAKDMVARPHFRIFRKFKYMFPDEPKKETIIIRDDFKRYVTISDYDWYKLVGYVLTRGFIRMKPGKPMVFLFLDEDRIEEEILILGDILDRIGVGWHVQYSEKTRPKIVVSSRNTLASRLVTRLGASKRKEMYLPDKMVYNSSKELSKLLIDTIIDASGQKDRERVQLVTTNKRFIDTLSLLGTLAGYSMRNSLMFEAGTETARGVTKKDSYIFNIFPPVDSYAPKYVKKVSYTGAVYEIDLFEGQVYVKEGSMPVWVNPK